MPDPQVFPLLSAALRSILCRYLQIASNKTREDTHDHQ